MFREFRSQYHKLNHALQVYRPDTALALWSQDTWMDTGVALALN